MFGGHVHSPSKSLHHSTSPSQRGESRSLISPRRESPSKLYLRNEKENVWGACPLTKKVFFTPLLRVNVENPDDSSAPAECRRPDSIQEMKRIMFGGHVHSPRKSSPLHFSESTWRIPITHQPQRSVAVKTLSKK